MPVTLKAKPGRTLTAKPLRGEPEPLPTGDIEQEAYEELDALQAGFRERAATDKARFEDAVEGDFWVCVCFQSLAHKNDFLAQTGLGQPDERFVDGLALADRLGVKFSTPVPAVRKVRDHAGLKKLARQVGK